MSLEVRKANVDDFPRVRYFYQYCEKHSDQEHALEKINDDMLREAVENEKVYLCFQEDNLIGAMILKAEERKAWITHIAIHPAFFGRGILNMMVQYTLNHLQANNITNVQLFIPEDNIQQANMFKNLGFKPGMGSWLEYLFEE